MSSYPLFSLTLATSAAPPSSEDSTTSASVSSLSRTRASHAMSGLSCERSARMEGTALSRQNSGYSSG